ncbi:unnamed protein product [Rhizophagus irregularis]|nr:unnamed protein product [Rhizophagus irregularis]
MEISKMSSKKNLWKFNNKYQLHVTISTIDSTNLTEEIIDERIVNIKDKEKRKKAYGGFGKIYSAKWIEGNIISWDIENQEWERNINQNVILKSLDNSSSCITTDFLNEIKSHLQIYLVDVIQCYGITQDPNTKDYMMVLFYCDDLPEPVNSDVIQSTLISECFDCQLDESDLNEDN